MTAPSAGQPSAEARGRWYAHGEVGWKRWGLGVEVSFGYWWPPEWSAHVHIGPFLFCAGWEEDVDWALWRLHEACRALLPPSGGPPKEGNNA